MKKNLLFTIIALFAMFAAKATINGPSSGCTGTTAFFTDSTLMGGTWSSSNPAIAAINDTTGVASAITTGTVTISYTTALSTDVFTFTVGATPPAITATATSICVGGTTTVSDAMVGGAWTSSNSYVATINSAGTVYGVHNGSTSIVYASSTGCTTSITITVGVGTAGSLTLPSTVCLGSSVSVVDSFAGGTWSSSNPSVASVSGSTSIGTINGLAVGTATISYTIVAACGTIYATAPITVINSVTAPAAITGPTTVVSGSTIALADATSGGTWSVSPSTVASINSITGVLTGVGTGTAGVDYTVSGCGTSAATGYTVNVTAFDGIAGTIHFGGTPYYGGVKVWLIKYVAPMLTAVDSAIVYCSGASATYQFTGMSTDSFRVKAALDSTYLVTSYIPTYHTNSFYWGTADVIAHTAGTADMGKDINMMTGTVTSGPGFIGGDVTTGANKGTTTSVPVTGLMMYLFNSTTLQLIQGVRTDAAGHYSFSNLPVGATYYVFPDSLNYTTIPYTSIALTTAAPSMTAAAFVQHTLSHVISPVPAGVSNVSASASSILAFPNPSNGRVNIAWQLPSAQAAVVSVTDITGRQVYKTSINMTEGAGNTQLDLSSLNNGMYNISVKSAVVNYNSKIEVLR